MPTLDQALQIAWDVGRCTTCDGKGSIEPLVPCVACGSAGATGVLLPEVAVWLANIAMHHPQVATRVCSALPGSGARWASGWATVSFDFTYNDRHFVLERDHRSAVSGQVLGTVSSTWHWGEPETWSWSLGDGVDHPAPTQNDARAEVDSRLLADGWLLGGAVYKPRA